MSLDEELRELERAAAQGDPMAAARLEELRRRAGRLIPVPVVVPPLGESVDGADVGEVLAAPGARVRKDEVLLVLECDKVSVELVAPADGFVTAVTVAPGERVAIGGGVVELVCAELPDDPWALLAIAQAARAAGDGELALRALDRAVPVASCGAGRAARDAVVEAGRARLYEMLGRVGEALACWRAVLDLTPAGGALREEAAARVARLQT